MLGSDFELFMFKKSGEFVPEFNLNLPDKFETHVTLKDAYGQSVGTLHRDNVSVEMCTPAVEPANFASAVAKTFMAAQDWVVKRLEDVVFRPQTTVSLTPEQQLHENAQELGCDIDYVPDLKQGASVPRRALDASMLADQRFSGGHIHISYPTEMLPPWVAAMLCDLFLGFANRSHLDEHRAKWYGNAALHRATKYPGGATGVEYRPLDSSWVHTEPSRLRVARGASISHALLNLQDNDSIMALMRLRNKFPDKMKLVDISPDDAGSVHEDALEVARRYVEVDIK